jgi:anti-anti-sigma factor
MVVEMIGRLDLRTSGRASTELNKIAQVANRKVLLNVDKLEYVSGAGLHAILVAAKLAQVNGGAIKICRANATVKPGWRSRASTASSTSTTPRRARWPPSRSAHHRLPTELTDNVSAEWPAKSRISGFFELRRPTAGQVADCMDHSLTIPREVR